MEYLIFAALLIGFVSLSAQINQLKSKLDKTAKSRKNLSSFINKHVIIDLNDEYDTELEGILISCDQRWFELKVSNNGLNEFYYKKVNMIKSITLKD